MVSDNKEGRPTKYTVGLLEACEWYLENYKELGDQMPSHIGMFLHIGISRTCGYDWAKDKSKPEFSDMLDRCMMLQHQKLFNNGLTGNFNSTITKLALAKHGYHDKVEQDNISSDGSMTPKVIRRIMVEAKDISG